MQKNCVFRLFSFDQESVSNGQAPVFILVYNEVFIVLWIQ